MKTKLIIIITLFLGASIFVGCTKQNNSPNSLNMEKYSQLSTMISSQLDQISTNLRSLNSNFSSQKDVLKSAKGAFGTNINEYNSFIGSYQNTLKIHSKLKEVAISDSIMNSLSQEQQIIFRNIFDSLRNSSSLDNFKNYLKKQYSDIPIDNKLTNNEKDFMLTYLTGYIASINFLENNTDLVKSSTQVIGFKNTLNWWTSWGKCAAGVLGGAGIGALTGGAAASVIPVLGTTAGIIIGGVFGGLAGAGASC